MRVSKNLFKNLKLPSQTKTMNIFIIVSILSILHPQKPIACSQPSSHVSTNFSTAVGPYIPIRPHATSPAPFFSLSSTPLYTSQSSEHTPTFPSSFSSPLLFPSTKENTSTIVSSLLLVPSTISLLRMALRAPSGNIKEKNVNKTTMKKKLKKEINFSFFMPESNYQKALFPTLRNHCVVHTKDNYFLHPLNKKKTKSPKNKNLIQITSLTKNLLKKHEKFSTFLFNSIRSLEAIKNKTATHKVKIKPSQTMEPYYRHFYNVYSQIENLKKNNFSKKFKTKDYNFNVEAVSKNITSPESGTSFKINKYDLYEDKVSTIANDSTENTYNLAGDFFLQKQVPFMKKHKNKSHGNTLYINKIENLFTKRGIKNNKYSSTNKYIGPYELNSHIGNNKKHKNKPKATSSKKLSIEKYINKNENNTLNPHSFETINTKSFTTRSNAFNEILNFTVAYNKRTTNKMNLIESPFHSKFNASGHKNYKTTLKNAFTYSGLSHFKFNHKRSLMKNFKHDQNNLQSEQKKMKKLSFKNLLLVESQNDTRMPNKNENFIKFFICTLNQNKKTTKPKELGLVGRKNSNEIIKKTGIEKKETFNKNKTHELAINVFGQMFAFNNAMLNSFSDLLELLMKNDDILEKIKKINKNIVLKKIEKIFYDINSTKSLKKSVLLNFIKKLVQKVSTSLSTEIFSNAFGAYEKKELVSKKFFVVSQNSEKFEDLKTKNVKVLDDKCHCCTCGACVDSKENKKYNGERFKNSNYYLILNSTKTFGKFFSGSRNICSLLHEPTEKEMKNSMSATSLNTKLLQCQNLCKTNHKVLRSSNSNTINNFYSQKNGSVASKISFYECFCDYQSKNEFFHKVFLNKSKTIEKEKKLIENFLFGKNKNFEYEKVDETFEKNENMDIEESINIIDILKKIFQKKLKKMEILKIKSDLNVGTWDYYIHLHDGKEISIVSIRLRKSNNLKVKVNLSNKYLPNVGSCFFENLFDIYSINLSQNRIKTLVADAFCQGRLEEKVSTDHRILNLKKTTFRKENLKKKTLNRSNSFIQQKSYDDVYKDKYLKKFFHKTFSKFIENQIKIFHTIFYQTAIKNLKKKLKMIRKIAELKKQIGITQIPLKIPHDKLLKQENDKHLKDFYNNKPLFASWNYLKNLITACFYGENNLIKKLRINKHKLEHTIKNIQKINVNEITKTEKTKNLLQDDTNKKTIAWKNLEYLDLSHNLIEDVANISSNRVISNLKFLFLSHNKIRFLPLKLFQNFPHLVLLDIRQNLIDSLNPFLLSHFNLKSAILFDNEASNLNGVMFSYDKPQLSHLCRHIATK